MNVALWILAGLLAVAFAGAGTMKLTKQRSEVLAQMAWAADVSDSQFRAIGAVELLGAIGVILPAAVDIAPVLVPIAAVGLAATMVGAVIVHVRRKDPVAATVPAVVVGVLALLLAIGRFGPEAF